MRIISHRGNLSGERSSVENTLNSINSALREGFDVEVDIWRKDDAFWLGHDFPQYYLFDHNLLEDQRIWFHAKNLEALHYMNSFCNKSNFFWHQKDDYTLTSSGKIWTYPGMNVCEDTVIVALSIHEVEDAIKKTPFAVCTDYPLHSRNFTEKNNMEKKYSSYVEICAMENFSPIPYHEFRSEIENGKCEYCLLLDDAECECKK